ncbi:oxidoreductase [Agaricicola taiwanensis]|uniref:Oxidoreductase n=2 Tax=Agaricicola taiwanensis TaxID=591372 RepID=A0A8J2W3X6_9RHOB|nr:oxidoreductase [Agaricicola taiwanensis]
MTFRSLGRSGLKVSRLVLGAMMFGGRTEEAEAHRIIADARDRGVNFIDTADSYAQGRSEEVVGRAIKAERFDWVLATKLGNPIGTSPLTRGLSRRWIFEEVERSLRRLDTETIDILYLHKEDHNTPLEETVRALADLVRTGKIRYFGVSNHRGWRLARIASLCDQAGIDRPAACQLHYHALNRTAEVELLPAAAALGIGTVAYSPLARGVLTGKYPPDVEAPEGSRAARGDKRILESEFHPENLAAAARLKQHAEGRGIDLASFAGAWVLANPLINGLIAGPRTYEQWVSYLTALNVSLDSRDEEAVDALVAPGATAVPQYTDPSYPVEGRPRR